jgi:hypothetical protein
MQLDRATGAVIVQSAMEMECQGSFPDKDIGNFPSLPLPGRLWTN